MRTAHLKCSPRHFRSAPDGSGHSNGRKHVSKKETRHFRGESALQQPTRAWPDCLSCIQPVQPELCQAHFITCKHCALQCSLCPCIAFHLHEAYKVPVQAHGPTLCATSKDGHQPSTMVCPVACLPQQLLCDPRNATTDIIAELKGAAQSPRFEQLLVKEDVREAVAVRLQQVGTCPHHPCARTSHPALKRNMLQCTSPAVCIPSTKPVPLKTRPACSPSMTLLARLDLRGTISCAVLCCARCAAGLRAVQGHCCC